MARAADPAARADVDEPDVALREVGVAALRVLPVRVAAVFDYVARREQLAQRLASLGAPCGR